MKKALLLVIFLGVVSAISGLSVGLVNSVTEPMIQERLLAAEKENLEKMYPGAEFAPVEFKDESGFIDGVYAVNGAQHAVKLHTTGYNSGTPIILLVGFDAEGTIEGVVCLQQQETDGFGARVFQAENIESLFVGKTVDQQTDLLSGATVTSTACQKAIAAAQSLVKGL